MAIETECSADRPYIVEVGNLTEALKKSSKLGLDAKSPLTVRSCIFKVPEVLRRHKPEAYKPDVISIGPFHHKNFQRMETVKQWYLKSLLSRMKTSLEKFIEDFNDFLLREEKKDIIEFGNEARDFYEEPLDLEHREFMEIMILDGCFVIQLVQKFMDRKKADDPNKEKKDDPILDMDCMFQYVCHDLLLLENQLPWFVLSCLYRFIWYKSDQPPFIVGLLAAFSKLQPLSQYLEHNLLQVQNLEDKHLHILDLIRTSIVPNPQKRSSIVSGFQSKEEEFGYEIPSATALSEAGVRFIKKGSADNLLNIKFEKGELTIPELAIGELTEPLFSNLIAFEQCYHDCPHQITSYAFFMDKLISSDKDIKLLSETKIIRNLLNDEDASNFLNRLYSDTTVNDVEFLYHTECAGLNEYYDTEWNKHWEQFRRNYCSTPWKKIALAVGILILVVQLFQLILSVPSSTLF